MKAGLLLVVLILGGLLTGVNNTYACPFAHACLYIKPKYAFPGEAVEMDASRSYPDIIEYKFCFDGDQQWEYTETESSAPDECFDGKTTHVYPSTCWHVVYVQVKNRYGKIDTCFNRVDIIKVKNITSRLGYNTVQDALGNAANGDEIWVTAGTYYPYEGSNPEQHRSETFQLVEGVSLYGGFCGTETVRDDRDWLANETILSGDIDQDGPDDSYHVVTGADDAIIDGFTITGGYANGSGNDGYGGGMLNISVSPIIQNCIFEDNLALYGGAICNYTAAPKVTHTIFNYNYAFYGGGICNLDLASTSGLTQEIVSSTFWDNDAINYGGAIYCESYYGTKVSNSTLWESNQDDTLGNVQFVVISELNIALSLEQPLESLFEISYSNYHDYGYNDSSCIVIGSGNIDTDPLFANAASGDFHLKSAETDGRWDPTANGDSGGWVTDSVTSPCINGGDPASNYSSEPSPNGNRINIGAYGNTPEASKSELYPFKYLLQTNDQYALPTEAAWSISGGSVNMSDLESNQIIMIPTGAYTVSFDCDNDTPYIVDAEGQSKTVTSSSVNYYTATYQACGALQISAFCPATLGYGGSAWGRFSCDEGSTWNIPYNYIPNYVKVLPDSYTIEFEDYSLLNTPDDIIDVTVSAYNVVQIIRTYFLNDVYVEPVSGDDSNIGTSGSPVKTVTNAAVKVKISGTVYITNYYILFLHQVTQEYRGKINENVFIDEPVTIRYTGSYPPLHIFGNHNLNPAPQTIGVIFEYE